MTCSSCGHANRAGRRFCAECGAPLALRCFQCSAENQPGEKFCGECGAILVESRKPVLSKVEGLKVEGPPTTGAPAHWRAGSPAAYTPKHLADKILQSKSALEGERKQVTVLFADVKGSMELAEQVDPEEWHRIMGRCARASRWAPTGACRALSGGESRWSSCEKHLGKKPADPRNVIPTRFSMPSRHFRRVASHEFRNRWDGKLGA